MNVQKQDNVTVIGNRVTIDGVELPPAPCKGERVATINGKVFIDGYEFKNGKWKKTLRAIWHKWFWWL